MNSLIPALPIVCACVVSMFALRTAAAPQAVPAAATNLTLSQVVSNATPQLVDGEKSARQPPRTTAEHTWTEIAFSCAVLGFGLLTLLLECWLALKDKLAGDLAFKIIGVTIVVTAGLFVIPAGYSQDQMSPLMGLLGAVAGYLLGKESLTRAPSTTATSQSSPSGVPGAPSSAPAGP